MQTISYLCFPGFQLDKVHSRRAVQCVGSGAAGGGGGGVQLSVPREDERRSLQTQYQVSPRVLYKQQGVHENVIITE